jgi:TPR repeat protein
MTHAARFVAALVALALCVPVQAQTPEIDEALAPAEAGDAEAQYSLGARYVDGDGVPENDVLAHMWFTVTAARTGCNSKSRG